MHKSRVRLATPNDFNVWSTVYSHGWCSLQPFRVDQERGIMTIVLAAGEGVVGAALTSNGASAALELTSAWKLTTAEKTACVNAVRECLRLNEDFSVFHRECRKYPEYRWIAKRGAGRMLRSPSVFEDIVKTLCTTNCTWALTTLMVNNLVEQLGVAGPDGTKTFPSPAALAAVDEKFLRTVIKSGYRSPFILEFARAIAEGRLECESWRRDALNPDIPTEELIRRLHAIKGVGPYAAGNVLKLLGRYDELALDSWVRQKFYELHYNNRKVKDSTIEKYYKPFGPWRGLFFWLEMTKYWYDEKFPI